MMKNYLSSRRNDPANTAAILSSGVGGIQWRRKLATPHRISGDASRASSTCPKSPGLFFCRVLEPVSTVCAERYKGRTLGTKRYLCVSEMETKHMDLYTGGHETKTSYDLMGVTKMARKLRCFRCWAATVWCHFAFVDIFADPYIDAKQRKLERQYPGIVCRQNPLNCITRCFSACWGSRLGNITKHIGHLSRLYTEALQIGARLPIGKVDDPMVTSLRFCNFCWPCRCTAAQGIFIVSWRLEV